jgi:hypothetical protein
MNNTRNISNREKADPSCDTLPLKDVVHYLSSLASFWVFWMVCDMELMLPASTWSLGIDTGLLFFKVVTRRAIYLGEPDDENGPSTCLQGESRTYD